jgi:bacterioferritin (cytochrome b1)
MPTAPANVIDALNSLLEAELNSIFRLIEDGFPYLSRANADVRKTISQLAQLSHKHANELADLIDSLGGVALPRHVVRPEGQYLAYLSVQFLLPKLVAEKELLLERYRNTRLFIGSDNAQVVAALDRIIAEQREYLALLRKAAEKRIAP